MKKWPCRPEKPIKRRYLPAYLSPISGGWCASIASWYVLMLPFVIIFYPVHHPAGIAVGGAEPDEL